MRAWRWAFLTAVFSLVAAWAVAAEVGQPAPDFSLPDEHGNLHHLHDYRGRIVVLEWTNPDCPFVQRHYRQKTMLKLYEKYRNKGVVWMAVNSTYYNKPEDTREWARRQGIPYPTLQDPTGEVGQRYGARTTPHMFVIDPGGVLVYAGAIDDDPYGEKGGAARNYVDEVLAALIRGRKPPVRETKPYGCTVKYPPAENPGSDGR